MSAANLPPTLPGSAANEPGSPKLVLPPAVLRAGAGADWIADGWDLFRKAILMWIIFLVLFFLVHVVLGLIPWIGGLATTLISPILVGGMVAGCRALETGGELELDHFIAGFKRNTGLLLAIGIAYVAGQIVLLLVFSMFAGWSVIWAVLAGNAGGLASAFAGSILTLVLGGLVVAALAIPLMAAVWFAPALAMLHDMPALPALRESFFACLRNWLPMLVYSLLMGLLLIVAAIPFGLGLLVWIPMLFTSYYASYRGIFTEPDVRAE